MLKIKKAVPDFFTIANLIMGCQAIVFAFDRNYHYAALCIGLAAVFDFFDGFFARLLKVGGEFGKQLDSLADAVTFGLAPGMIMFQLFKEIIEMNTISSLNKSPYLHFLPYIAWMIPVFSVIRLAKFNIDARQTNNFIGLPTPANAAFFAFIGFVCQNSYGVFKENSLFLLDLKLLIPLIVFMCFLMVSEIPMFSLKFKNFSWSSNRLRFLFLAAVLGLFLLSGAFAIPIGVLLYVVASVLNYFFNFN